MYYSLMHACFLPEMIIASPLKCRVGKEHGCPAPNSNQFINSVDVGQAEAYNMAIVTERL